MGFHIQLTQGGSTVAEVSQVVSGYMRRGKSEKLEILLSHLVLCAKDNLQIRHPVLCAKDNL